MLTLDGVGAAYDRDAGHVGVFWVKFVFSLLPLKKMFRCCDGELYDADDDFDDNNYDDDDNNYDTDDDDDNDVDGPESDDKADDTAVKRVSFLSIYTRY